MAAFVSLFLAFIWYYRGGALVERPQFVPESPPLTEILFIIVTFVFIWNMTLYPKTFRKVHWIPSVFIECTLAKLIQELSIKYLWYPLDTFLFSGLIVWLDYFSNIINRNQNTHLDLYNMFGGYLFSTMLCYSIAFIFMASVLHAVGIWDVDIGVADLFSRLFRSGTSSNKCLTSVKKVCDNKNEDNNKIDGKYLTMNGNKKDELANDPFRLYCN